MHHKRFREYCSTHQQRIFNEALPLLEKLQAMTRGDLPGLIVAAMKRTELINLDEFVQALVESTAKRIKCFVDGLRTDGVRRSAAQVQAPQIAMALHKTCGSYKVWLELQKVLTAAGYPVSVSGAALTEVSHGMKQYLNDLLAVTELHSGYGFESLVDLLQLNMQRSIVETDFLKRGRHGNQYGYVTPKNNSYPLIMHLDGLMSGGHKYLSVMLSLLTDPKNAHKMKNQLVTMVCKGGDGHQNLKLNLVSCTARPLPYSERHGTRRGGSPMHLTTRTPLASLRPSTTNSSEHCTSVGISSTWCSTCRMAQAMPTSRS